MSQFRRNSEFHSPAIHRKSETPRTASTARSKTQAKAKTPTSRSRNPFFRDSNVSQSIKIKDSMNSVNTNSFIKENPKNQQKIRSTQNNNKSNLVASRKQKKAVNNQQLDVKDPFKDFVSFLTEGINHNMNKENLLEEYKNVSFKPKKKCLMCSNLISIQHYYQEEEKENIPLPFKGNLISKINNLPILKLKVPKNNENCDANAFESPIVSQNKPTNLTIITNEEDEDKQKSNDDHSDQQEEELQFVIPIMVSANTTPRTQKQAVRINPNMNKSEELVSKLFADDGVPIHFFDFDFATSYVLNNCDVMPEKDPYNLFPLFSQLDSHKKDDLTKIEVVENLVQMLFRSSINTKVKPTENADDKNNNAIVNFTSLLSPEIDNTNVDSKTNKINAISPSCFFDFRFGDKASDYSTDRLHIYTWHNLGIPASQIAKNLILYVTSPNDHLDVQIELQGIIQYILIWLKYFPKDFEDKSNRCADIIMQLMKKLVNKLKQPNSNINIVRAFIESIADGAIKAEDFHPQINLPIFKPLDVNKTSKLVQLNVDPCILANHLTYIDLQMINKLQRNEFLHSRWRNNPEESQNFQNLMKRFNETVEFIITSILVDSEKRRARNISYWIKIMYQAKKTRNFHLMATIDSALSSLPILRLTSSWKTVNENALLAFKRLHNYFRISKNQEEMFVKPSNTVPFIGVFVSQLDQLEDEEYKTTLKTGEMAYNLILQRKTLYIIEEMFLPWGVSLSFELDNDILVKCSVLDDRISNPNDMLEASLKYEPMKYSEKTLLDDFFVSKQ